MQTLQPPLSSRPSELASESRDQFRVVDQLPKSFSAMAWFPGLASLARDDKQIMQMQRDC
jgi:hypothetical protein